MKKLSDIMSEEERREWAEINEIAFEALGDRKFGDCLRKRAFELFSTGKYTTKIDAMHEILLGVLRQRKGSL